MANFEVEDMQSSIKPLEEQANPVAVSAQATQTSQAPQTAQVTSESVEVQEPQPETTGDPAPVSVDGAQPMLSEAETYKLQGYYIVEKGDSLAVISQKIYQNKDMVPQICAKTGLPMKIRSISGKNCCCHKKILCFYENFEKIVQDKRG